MGTQSDLGTLLPLIFIIIVVADTLDCFATNLPRPLH